MVVFVLFYSFVCESQIRVVNCRCSWYVCFKLCSLLLLVCLQMPILYTVIARGSMILTKYAACVGNFSEVTEQILNKIPSENSKLTYSHSNYLFHYIKEDGIVYLCITDDVSLLKAFEI